MAAPETISEGFLGFSPQLHSAVDHRTRPGILNPTANPVKKYTPVKWVSGKLEHCAVVGTDEVTTFTPSSGGNAITGGTFTVTWGGVTSAAIPYNVTAAQFQTYIEAMSNVGKGNVLAAGGPFPGTALTLQWIGIFSGTNITAPTTTDTSLTSAGTADITVTTSTAGVLGVISDAQFCGFSGMWEAGPVNNWPKAFGMGATDYNLPWSGANPTGTNNRELIYYPARGGAAFWGSIDPAQALTRDMADTTCDIGWHPYYKRAFLRVGSTTNAIARIIGVLEDEVGVYGGRALFIIPDSATQLES